MNLFDALDSDLWTLACRDDQSAFEQLVRRHQSAVCAVAYSACGDLSLSEDVSQETFWVAWQDRTKLIDPSRLRAWLCGIARNLAHNALKRGHRRAASLDDCAEPTADTVEPVEQVVTREEEDLVWSALEKIPEAYREPLVLFYRENQSVADVAATLEMSTDAVKQRLSRGRNLLRDQVTELIEGTLTRTKPRGRFTVGVMAGLASSVAGSKAAFATAGSSTTVVGGGLIAKGTSAVIAAPVLGGLLGSAAGFFGGWLGTWLPAQMAPTNRERLMMLARGRRILLVSAVLTLTLIAAMMMLVTSMSPWIVVSVSIGWVIFLNAYLAIETLLLVRAIQKIRRETPADADPNTSWMNTYVQQRVVTRWEGRIYQSQTRWLGRPLIDIQVSSPQAEGTPQPQKTARGWIAIGDRANGLILALGGFAQGTIAIGGVTIGVFSFGGLAFGLVTVGGLAVGAIALGGMAVGGIAFGGGAIGWQAAGGAAVAWDVACGGAAIACHAAEGGAAIARDFAVGGSAHAAHANDNAARAVLKSHWLVQSMNWYTKNSNWPQAVLITACVVPSVAVSLLMYRRRPASEMKQ